MKNSVKSTKSVLFHSKRKETICEGVINGGFDAGYFGINIVYSFENIEKVIENSGIENFHDEYDIENMASSWNDETKQWFNNLKIINVSESDKNKTVYITVDDLGEAIVRDENNDEVCTVEEYGAVEGVFDIKGSYDKYFWKPFNKLNEAEMLLFANHYERDYLIRELYPNDVDELIIFIVDNPTCYVGYLDGIFCEEETIEELVKRFYLKVTTSEEEAKEYPNIEINGKYYYID